MTLARLGESKQQHPSGDGLLHQRTGRGGLGGLQPPLSEKNSIIRAKLMYCSGKDTVKNILLFNILIYLSSSCIPQNGFHDILPVLYKDSYLHPGVEVIVLHTSFRAQMGTFYLSLHGFVFSKCSSRFTENICTTLNARALTAWRRKLDVMKESSCAPVTNKFHLGKLCSAPPTKFLPYADVYRTL